MEKKLLAIIQIVIGYEWLEGGIEKIKQGAEFVNGFAGMMTKVASKNPHAFYKDFLLNSVVPMKDVYGTLIPWSELLAGIILIIGAGIIIFGKNNIYLRYLSLITLLGVVFMNLNFWFAFGYSSVSTAGLNLIMGLVELVLLIAWLKVFTTTPKKAK